MNSPCIVGSFDVVEDPIFYLTPSAPSDRLVGVSVRSVGEGIGGKVRVEVLDACWFCCDRSSSAATSCKVRYLRYPAPML